MGPAQGLGSSPCNEVGPDRRLLPSCPGPADSDPGRHFCLRMPRGQDLPALFRRRGEEGLLWWPRAEGSMFPVQGAQVQPLVGEIDSTCRNQEFACHK